MVLCDDDINGQNVAENYSTSAIRTSSGDPVHHCAEDPAAIAGRVINVVMDLLVENGVEIWRMAEITRSS